VLLYLPLADRDLVLVMVEQSDEEIEYTVEELVVP